MKRFLLFALVAIAFAACNAPDLPKPTGGTANFSYIEESAYYIKFYNTSSSGLTPYVWDFGDGTSVAGGNIATHSYAKKGTYEVTLTCKDKNNYRYDVTKNVTVTGTAQ